MLWLATAELASAVSNAGAFGVVSPLAGMKKDGNPSENFSRQLKTIQQYTEKSFGVNIPLDLPYADDLICVALAEHVRVVITAAGDPSRYTEMLKSRGVKTIHVVSQVKQAKLAERCGVDAVIAEGIEAAAHNGPDELPLISLIPQISDAVSIPVIAAGGIVDARGIVAAEALGAEGVQLGTRFIAVEENVAHLNYKKAVIDAGDTDTVITCRGIVPTRSLKTDFTKILLELEKAGADARSIRDYIGYRSNRSAQIDGDLNGGEAYCGASAGLIKEILPVKEVIRRLIEGYEIVLKRLN